ncbi:T7SS effector LXG polymorphic toxin [Streptococcus equi]|uniref:Membrane protein n=1 Tax=Streptococcus equi subsp. zooepidemicus TaxID=40041 RepID=A0A7Z9D237_STRSZ|nr:T7SS effector LXG polymorphic toxin [Streptococcus equi]VEF08035.1 membrane protein [Streptococcus equi subsp. zooepidemicus]
MGYKIHFEAISAAQQSTQTTISAWGDGMTSIQTALSALIGDSRLQGQTASSIKSYLSEVHGTLLQTLQSLMNDYSASLLLYKDGYYQIDSNSHAQLPGQVFKTLQSELRLSQAHLKDQLELLQNARAKVSDLVHYSGVSHAKTVVDYSELITDINRLDEAIIQYESNHARQDLAAFKELLASTKALIAEYSSKPKRAGSYQVGDIGQLNTIKRFATAYQGVARHLETNAKRLQAVQERDQARFEAVAAEDRASQGWVDLALSLVTIAVGVAAIVMTAGAATPLVVGAFVAGSGTVAYGASNLYEAGHNIYLGQKGDGLTVATNPLRDTLFMGNDRLYHQLGRLFTTASAVMIPIGQTKSIAKGLTEFTIGEVGGFIGGQASYHGTKLLGGSDQDAQRATLVGNILGGIAASSATRRFSLNEPIAARVTKPAKITLSEKVLDTNVRFDESRIVAYAESMSKNYTEADVAKLTELTTHNAKSQTALLGYYEANSVTSYEQIAHHNKLTYFDAGSDGWNAMAKVDRKLAPRVNKEFLVQQTKEGKDFILSSNPYKARQYFIDSMGKGESFMNEMNFLRDSGYKFEKYGKFWRAYK